jgi:ribosomal protein S15P/S13E
MTSHIIVEFRRAAETAKHLAAQSTDEAERRDLLRIAAEWEHLAEYREQTDRQLSKLLPVA